MKLIDFIVCDDVRQEIGNKFTLIGVYDRDIRIQTKDPSALTWPLPTNLALFFRVQLEPSDSGLDTFELSVTHDEKELAKIQGGVASINRDKAITINARMPGFPLPGPGLLKFQLKFSDHGKTIFDIDAPKSVQVSVEKV